MDCRGKHSMIPHLLRTFARPTPSRTRRQRRQPSLETLEGRQLMSLGPEFPISVGTQSDNASSANGSSVAVWTDASSDIRAQRFNALGDKVGPEIVVTASVADEFSPAVTMDDQGNFVVTWTQQTQPGGDTDVLARRFNSAGSSVGGIIEVGASTLNERDPDVAMDAQGNFVVSYTRDTNGNNPDIFAKRYDGNGQPLGVISVATSIKAETHSSVAMTPDGRFDVAWEEAVSSTNHDIKLKRYNASGGLLGTHPIASSAVFDTPPSVSMDNFANAVVAWQQRAGTDSDVKARRISAFGFLGGEINIANSPTTFEQNPSVALERFGGGFVVAYDSTSPSGGWVKVAEVSASNTVTIFDAGSPRFDPAVSINGFNRYLVTSTGIAPIPVGAAVIYGRFGQLS